MQTYVRDFYSKFVAGFCSYIEGVSNKHLNINNTMPLWLFIAQNILLFFKYIIPLGTFRLASVCD
jgi:hypothetical protein